MRWGARERLREAARELDEALVRGDGHVAVEAAAKVEDCLALLRAVPAVGKGRRARAAMGSVDSRFPPCGNGERSTSAEAAA